MFTNNETTRQFIAKHFHKRGTPLTEDAILQAIAAPRSQYDIYWGVLALRDCGTERSIPALKALLHYPMQDVKDCSLLTIARLGGAAETPFYLEALALKGSRKTYPMWAIEAVADERAIPAVIELVNAALRKASRPKPADPGDAYLSGFKFFNRLGVDRPEFQASLALLKQAWPKLAGVHRSVLSAILPGPDVTEAPKAQ